MKDLKQMESFDNYEKLNSECRGRIKNKICKHGDLNNLNTVLWGR